MYKLNNEGVEVRTQTSPVVDVWNRVLTSMTCSFVSLVREIPSSASTAMEMSFRRGGAGSSLNFAKLLNCLRPSW